MAFSYVIARTRTLIGYAAAGAVAGTIELTLVHILTTRTSVWYVYASAISAATSCLISFLLRKVYVFHDRNWKTFGRQLLAYIGVLILIILISTTTMSFLVEHFKLPYVLAQAVAGITSGLIGFFLNRQFTFHEPVSALNRMAARIKGWF